MFITNLVHHRIISNHTAWSCRSSIDNGWVDGWVHGRMGGRKAGWGNITRRMNMSEMEEWRVKSESRVL
jgi:hypothetical protein